MSYNGWSNYETWCCALWLNNEEPLYRDIQQLARESADEADGDNITEIRKCAASDLAGKIEEYVRENMIPDVGGFAADILSAAMSEINFEEIAAAEIGGLDDDDFPTPDEDDETESPE